MRCLMGIKILRLARCAGHHKKSHYFWECDQSHSQIDPSDRFCWHETPNYPTLGVPTFGGSQKGSLRCSHPAVPFLCLPVIIGSNVRYWHLADMPSCTAHVRYWGQSGHA